MELLRITRVKKVVPFGNIILYLFLSFFSNAQQDSLEQIVYNQVDTISSTQWVVTYEYRDQIDSIYYFPEIHKGIIRSFTKAGIMKGEETFQHELLEQPYIQFYESLRVPGSTELAGRNRYFGYRIDFYDDFLIQRKEYYESGGLKHIANFALLYSDMISVISQKDLSPIEDTIKVWKSTIHGESIYFLPNGAIEKIELYDTGERVEN